MTILVKIQEINCAFPHFEFRLPNRNISASRFGFVRDSSCVSALDLLHLNLSLHDYNLKFQEFELLYNALMIRSLMKSMDWKNF